LWTLQLSFLKRTMDLLKVLQSRKRSVVDLLEDFRKMILRASERLHFVTSLFGLPDDNGIPFCYEVKYLVISKLIYFIECVCFHHFSIKKYNEIPST
ncbi:hypothetical protein L9F63_024744, partial [Diploptera punctata]